MITTTTIVKNMDDLFAKMKFLSKTIYDKQSFESINEINDAKIQMNRLAFRQNEMDRNNSKKLAKSVVT